MGVTNQLLTGMILQVYPQTTQCPPVKFVSLSTKWLVVEIHRPHGGAIRRGAWNSMILRDQTAQNAHLPKKIQEIALHQNMLIHSRRLTARSSPLKNDGLEVGRRLSFLGWYFFRGELLNFQGVWWWFMIYNGSKQVNTTNLSKYSVIHCHVKRHHVVFHDVSRCYNPWVSCFKGCFHVSEITSYPRWRVFSHPISWNICKSKFRKKL